MKKSSLLMMLLLSLALVIAGCGGTTGGTGDTGGGYTPPPGGDTGGGYQPPPGGDTGGDTGGGPGGGGQQAASLSFDISGAIALLAQEDTISEVVASPRLSKSGKPVFTYKKWNQGLTKRKAASIRKSKELVRAAIENGTTDGTTTTDGGTGTTTEDTAAGTNLLAVDENGDSHLAISANYPIKVMYSVTDPQGDYVYLALETGWGSWDGNDYSSFIAQTNCALYKVAIADNTFSCVKEGLYVQSMDQNYMMTVSGDQKPIQFDNDGNVYFTATTFERTCEDQDRNNDGMVDEWEAQQGPWCWFNGSWNWRPRIYKAEKTTGTVTGLTTDLQTVEHFLVLPTGEVAYKAWDEAQMKQIIMLLKSDGNTYQMNSDVDWGINFFTVDTHDTIMWGSWSQSAVYFASPITGGFEKATLNTKLFGPQFEDCSWCTGTPPYRIIVGDDGRLYGVFQNWQSEYDDNDTPTDTSDDDWNYYTVLSVYQMLPYDGIPKVELKFSNDTGGWWGWMGDTPFKVAGGLLFYTEEQTLPGQGNRDIIRVVRLRDREKFKLLANYVPGGTSDRYVIYNWQISGGKLHFSGLDQNTNSVVTGEIDPQAFIADPTRPQAEYLAINETASASGAVSAIQDIEVLAPSVSTEDPATAPNVEEYFTSEDNIYSMSVDFTKHMDENSVEPNVTVSAPSALTGCWDTSDSTNCAKLKSMKVWIHKSLHLIPDLSMYPSDSWLITEGYVDTNYAGLADSQTDPLYAGTTYTIALTTDAKDDFGNNIGSGGAGLSTSFTTRPSSGWYVPSGNDAVLNSKVAKYAGSTRDQWGWTTGKQTYNISSDVPDDFRLEFDAVNTGWSGMDVLIWDQTNKTDYYDYCVAQGWSYCSDPWRGKFVSMKLGGQSELSYTYDTWLSQSSVYNSATYTWDYTDEYYDWWQNWKYGQTPDIFNGVWKKYRIEVYGTTLKVSVSEDSGATWNTVQMSDWSGVSTSMEYTDLEARLAGHEYRVLIRVQEPFALDNVKVTTLSSDGLTLPNGEGDLLNAGFTSNTDLDLNMVPNGDADGWGLDDNVTTTYGLDNWW